MTAVTQDKFITLGHPSYVWRRGQDRRLDLIRRYVRLEQRRILDVGCGLGMYVTRFRQFSDEVYGVDIDEEIEHVESDVATIREAVRCLRPGGEVVIFAPNRLYPFETHGFFLGKRF